MSEDEWKARAVGCESESKRLAGEVKRLTADLERMTGYLLDAREHIQAGAMWYVELEERQRQRAPGAELYRPRPVDYHAKQLNCRRLFDLIEAIEASLLGAVLDRGDDHDAVRNGKSGG